MRIGNYFLFAALLAFGASLASAQSSVDFGVGFGEAWDKASSTGIDSQSGASCMASTDPTCVATSSMNGFFLGFGGDIMLYKHFGVGAEFNVQPSAKNYGPLTDREMFYDFNGIYQPYATKRVALQLQGGIGGTRTSFSVPETECAGSACSTTNEPYISDSHFQIHVGAGVQIYLPHHLFIRPQFDLHYAPGLDNDFNSNLVPEATVWVGFTSGGQ